MQIATDNPPIEYHVTVNQTTASNPLKNPTEKISLPSLSFKNVLLVTKIFYYLKHCSD